MNKAHSTDSWEHSNDDHDVEVAIGTSTSWWKLYFIISLDCKAIDEDQKKGLAYEGITVKIACWPKNYSKKNNAYGSCSDFTWARCLEDIDYKICDIEGDKNEGEQFVP